MKLCAWAPVRCFRCLIHSLRDCRRRAASIAPKRSHAPSAYARGAEAGAGRSTVGWQPSVYRVPRICLRHLGFPRHGNRLWQVAIRRMSDGRDTVVSPSQHHSRDHRAPMRTSEPLPVRADVFTRSVDCRQPQRLPLRWPSSHDGTSAHIILLSLSVSQANIPAVTDARCTGAARTDGRDNLGGAGSAGCPTGCGARERNGFCAGEVCSSPLPTPLRRAAASVPLSSVCARVGVGSVGGAGRVAEARCSCHSARRAAATHTKPKRPAPAKNAVIQAARAVGSEAEDQKQSKEQRAAAVALAVRQPRARGGQCGRACMSCCACLDLV